MHKKSIKVINRQSRFQSSKFTTSSKRKQKRDKRDINKFFHSHCMPQTLPVASAIFSKNSFFVLFVIYLFWSLNDMLPEILKIKAT